MISLSYLNKFILFVIFFIVITFNQSLAEDEPADIWQDSENQNEEESQTSNEQDITIESPILSDDINKITVKIDEDIIQENSQSVIGIFDPEEHNFNLNMWAKTDGEEIKKILGRINKLKLSKSSEDLLFLVLFTNSYPPKKNLSSEDFLKIKINWLIKRNRIKDLEILLKTNSEVGQNSKAVKYLVNEYLSSANIKLACEKINFIDRKVQNNYLEKFTIYCLINNDRKEEANLIYDLLKERGFKDKFFDDKINFLLGITETSNQKILDDNLKFLFFTYNQRKLSV